MIDSVKSFLKVNNYHASILHFERIYFCFQPSYECMVSGGSFLKTKLKVLNSIFLKYEAMDSFVYYSFIDFTYVRK